VKETITLLKGDLDWIVMKCLEKDRTRRYETANGLVADITRHLNNEPVTARPPSAAYRFQKLVRRNKAAAIASAAIVSALVLGLGLAVAALVRERAARQRELAQTVRADTVATFIDGLLSDAGPTMIKQENNRGARELVETADRLAAASLSNSPAAEVRVRFKLAEILSQLTDFGATLKQAEAIAQLISKLPDDQLPAPREFLLLNVPVNRLWAAGGRAAEEQRVVEELEALSAKFMNRTPPAQELAMICRFHLGVWHLSAWRLDKAEALFADAYRLRPRKPVPGLIHLLPSSYARTLSALGKTGQAERVAREALSVPPEANLDARNDYFELVIALKNALCMQDRFDDALQMLAAHRRILVDKGASEAELVQIDRLPGHVLARAGKIHEALPILASLSTNRHAGAYYVWFPAASR
jgi:tetratricopeptide (TPR) repeat protein